MIANLLLGVCAAGCMYTFVGLASLARFLPALLSLVRYLARWLLVISFRLYRLILTLVAPFVKRYSGIDVLNGWVRLVVCTMLSLLVSLGVCVVGQLEMTVWGLLPGFLHGLLVGLLWDDLSQPGELQMGIKLS